MKRRADTFEVQVEELGRLAVGLTEAAGSLEWATGARQVLDGLAAGSGSRQVQRGAALVADSACRVMEAVAHELSRIARLADSAAMTYRAVDASVMRP